MSYKKTSILAHLIHSNEKLRPKFWIAAGAATISLFGMVAAFGTAPSAQKANIPQQTVLQEITPARAEQLDIPQGHFLRQENIRRGDTASSLLARLDIHDTEAFDFLLKNKETQAIFRQLVPGKVVSGTTDTDGILQSMAFPLNGQEDNVILIERKDGKLQAHQQSLQLDSELHMRSGEIHSSLFAAADAADIPDSIAIQMADIFGGDIDFHRDLRKGDRFSIVYEMLYHQGRPIRSGRILAAEFSNQGKTFQAIWFQADNQSGGYYDANGRSIRKAFLRSPLEFSRITSGFTLHRFHPILKKWRAHKGIDYAARTGTRVKATGDGIVAFAGRKGGYGNVVILRHQSHYTTYYAHLSRFAAGIRVGARVEQGEVIAYVGSTGWATGPHLHYEFRTNGIHQNPLTVALPTAPSLSPAQLAQFKHHVLPLVSRLDQIRQVTLARLDW